MSEALGMPPLLLTVGRAYVIRVGDSDFSISADTVFSRLRKCAVT